MTKQEWLDKARTVRCRAVARAGQRGVTLVEVLIVVAIMALIAGGVGFMILPKFQQARIDTARTNCRKIRQVTIQYMALQSAGDCPTVQTLIAEKELDAEAGAEDPWGNPYNIACSGDDVMVLSNGPDGQPGTEDDVGAGDVGGEG